MKKNPGTYRTAAQRELNRKVRQARIEAETKLFHSMLTSGGVSLPVREHKFNELVLSKTGVPRAWRFDWAWIPEKVALEVEGGAWTQGRHTRGKGFMDDMEKYNAARLQGWMVLRCAPRQLLTLKTLDIIREGLRMQREKYIYMMVAQ